MSHADPKVKEGWIPCEFAAMGDCLTFNGDFCDTHKDPDDCEKYHRKMVLEQEETQEEFNAWLIKKHSINKSNYSSSEAQR